MDMAENKVLCPSAIQPYQGSIRKKRRLIAWLLILTVIMFFVAMNAGAVPISLTKIVEALLGFGDEKTLMLIKSIRLPRVAAGIVAGTGLAISGCIMQNNLGNPLASPSTLGISNAAAFGANVAIILLGAGNVLSTGLGRVSISHPYTVTLIALFFALAATGFILSLSMLRKFSPESIILAGVAISSLFGAGTMIIQYFAKDTTSVAAVVFWTFGDLGRASWQEIWIMSAVVALCFIYFIFNKWEYNAIDAGEDNARSLGVNIERIRLGGMFAAALIAAVCVSFLGMIAFVGLVAPQITKRIIGNDKRFLITASAITGVLILLISDTLAREVLSPQTLPVGAVTAFLGGPMFLYLLIKGSGASR